MDDDKVLNEILDMRKVPTAPSNLSARIIEAARDMPQKQPWHASLLARLDAFGASLFAPRPALAFAVFVLLLVSVSGAGYFGYSYTQTDVHEDVYLAFYLDDIFEVDEI